MDAAPPSPTPQVYLGEQYLNDVTLSDVTFLVEGRRFYAHRIALLASSDTFRAMFDGGYRDISLDNVSTMYDLSESYHAISLRHTCILFILEQFDKLSARPGHSDLIQMIIPEIRNYFSRALTTKPTKYPVIDDQC